MPQCCALLHEFSYGKLALIPFAFCRSPFGLLHEFSYGKLAESFVKTTKTRDIFFKTCVYFCSLFCISHKNHTKKAAELVEAAVYDFPVLNKMQSETSDGFTATDKTLSEVSDGFIATDRTLSRLYDIFTATNRMPSEASDGFIASDKVPSEVSDGFTAFNNVLSEIFDTFAAISKHEFNKQGFALRRNDRRVCGGNIS